VFYISLTVVAKSIQRSASVKILDQIIPLTLILCLTILTILGTVMVGIAMVQEILKMAMEAVHP
jgi:hypothetical protein